MGRMLMPLLLLVQCAIEMNREFSCSDDESKELRLQGGFYYLEWCPGEGRHDMPLTQVLKVTKV